jgi:hypothetical protein
VRERKYIWGVTSASHAAIIGITKLRISIQDIHLLFQIVANAADSITDEYVIKLKEIHDNIEERENLQSKFRRKTEVPNRQKTEKKLDPDDLSKLPKNAEDNHRSYSEVVDQFTRK